MSSGSWALPRKLACWPGVIEPSRMTCGKATKVGTPPLRRGEAIDDGAVGREQVARVAQPLVVGRRGVAGEAVVAGRVVVLHRVPQRRGSGVTLSMTRRHARQPLADVQRRARGVAMGLNSPRISSGAAGFMSKVSCWLGPPHWCRKMTDFARAFGARGSARRRPRADAAEAGEPQGADLQRGAVA